MYQSACSLEPLPNQLDTAKAIDNPFVAVDQDRVRSKILFVREFTVKFIEHMQRQSRDCCNSRARVDLPPPALPNIATRFMGPNDPDNRHKPAAQNAVDEGPCASAGEATPIDHHS